jgi:hypothetical protein
MTDREEQQIVTRKAYDKLRAKPNGRRMIRKRKLRMRFKDRIGEEIASTVDKLELLREIEADG